MSILFPLPPWVPVEVFQKFVEHGALGSFDCRFQGSTSAFEILSGVDFKWPTRSLMRVFPRSIMRASLESLGGLSRPRSSTLPGSSVMWWWCTVYGHSSLRVFWVVRSVCTILCHVILFRAKECFLHMFGFRLLTGRYE